MKLQDLHSKLQESNKKAHGCISEYGDYCYNDGEIDQLTTSTINETLAWVREEIKSKRKTKNSIKHFSGMGYYNQQGYNQALTDLLTLLETKDTN